MQVFTSAQLAVLDRMDGCLSGVISSAPDNYSIYRHRYIVRSLTIQISAALDLNLISNIELEYTKMPCINSVLIVERRSDRDSIAVCSAKHLSIFPWADERVDDGFVDDGVRTSGRMRVGFH